jgi:hypothetical protein
MPKVIPTDVYDKDGSLLRLEFFNLEGEFEIQSEWDSNDEQTSENREAFRKWSYKMVKRLGFEIDL